LATLLGASGVKKQIMLYKNVAFLLQHKFFRQHNVPDEAKMYSLKRSYDWPTLYIILFKSVLQ